MMMSNECPCLPIVYDSTVFEHGTDAFVSLQHVSTKLQS